ncbi:MAG: DUF427 domain-containing protein [Nitrospiraceae bacterium]|nr:MAG: DUF427 domain-containing protein [Nitrospiraceae bacterium]
MRTEPIEPGPEQESVWDYPRPPRSESSSGHVKVTFNNVVLADTHTARRVLDTSHQPVFYIPPRDIEMHYLENSLLTTYCEI